MPLSADKRINLKIYCGRNQHHIRVMYAQNTRTLQNWHKETVDLLREKLAKNWKYRQNFGFWIHHDFWIHHARKSRNNFLEKKIDYWVSWWNWMDHLLFAAIVFLKSNYGHIIPNYGFMNGQFYIETILSDYAARMNRQQMTSWGKTLQLTRWNWTSFHLFISFLISFPLLFVTR